MEDALWSFKDIIARQGPLTKEDPHYKGSYVMIEWDTGETTYEPLSLIIQDESITCAVYAKKHGLLNTPGWKHLKKYVKTRKRPLRVAKQFKIRQVRKAIRYQFRNQVPRNYEDAFSLDMENGNHKWQDAMDVEMAQIKEYGVFNDCGKAKWKGKTTTNAPSGYQNIRVLFIFVVKHCGKFKVRLVADGPLTKEPMESVYSGVASLGGLRLVIFLGELNKLLLWGGDVGNAYLEALTREKLCIIAGPEFGELQGHILIIYKAIYGTRTGGAYWHDKLFDTLQHMDFQPSKADPDIWMKPTDDRQAYEYIAVYVDNLCVAPKDLERSFKPSRTKTSSNSREMAHWTIIWGSHTSETQMEPYWLTQGNM